MGILNAVIFTKPTWSMNVRKTEQFERRSFGRQPVGRDAFWLDWQVAKQALQQFRCRPRVPPPLDKVIQDLAFVIDSPP